ncbi:hypothetical protein LTR95_003962 [Oleoguttula sp. CCFEE 5521]
MAYHRRSKAPKLSTLQQKLQRWNVEPGATVEECKQLIRDNRAKYAEEQARRKAEHERIYRFFIDRYGGDNLCLRAWQRLCGDVEVKPGDTIVECQENLAPVYVYIYQFWDAMNNDKKIDKLPAFKDLKKLVSEKPYWKQEAKECAFLKATLKDLELRTGFWTPEEKQAHYTGLKALRREGNAEVLLNDREDAVAAAVEKRNDSPDEAVAEVKGDATEGDHGIARMLGHLTVHD